MLTWFLTSLRSYAMNCRVFTKNPSRFARTTCPCTSSRLVLYQENHWRLKASSLDQLADEFDTELYAELKINPCTGIRGLYTSASTRTAPVVAVPIVSCLVVPWRACPQQLHHIWRDLPQPLIKLLDGSQAHSIPGIQFLQLAAWLLWIRNHHQVGTIPSAWKTYCEDVLPPLADLHCLLTLSREEATHLPGQELQAEARRQRAWAEQLHNVWLSSHQHHSVPSRGAGRAASTLADLGLSHSLEDTLWALAVVRSRSFAMRLPFGGQITVMTPFMDLANHANGHPASKQSSNSASVLVNQQPSIELNPCTVGWNTRQIIAASVASEASLLDTSVNNSNLGLASDQGARANCEIVFSADQRRLLLQPLKPLETGEEVLIDYGWRSAIDSLADYGFVM